MRERYLAGRMSLFSAIYPLQDPWRVWRGASALLPLAYLCFFWAALSRPVDRQGQLLATLIYVLLVATIAVWTLSLLHGLVHSWRKAPWKGAGLLLLLFALFPLPFLSPAVAVLGLMNQFFADMNGVLDSPMETGYTFDLVWFSLVPFLIGAGIVVGVTYLSDRPMAVQDDRSNNAWYRATIIVATIVVAGEIAGFLVTYYGLPQVQQFCSDVRRGDNGREVIRRGNAAAYRTTQSKDDVVSFRKKGWVCFAEIKDGAVSKSGVFLDH